MLIMETTKCRRRINFRECLPFTDKRHDLIDHDSADNEDDQRQNYFTAGLSTQIHCTIDEFLHDKSPFQYERKLPVDIDRPTPSYINI